MKRITYGKSNKRVRENWFRVAACLGFGMSLGTFFFLLACMAYGAGSSEYSLKSQLSKEFTEKRAQVEGSRQSGF